MPTKASHPKPADIIGLISALNGAAIAGLKVPSHTDAFGSASRAETLAEWVLARGISPAETRDALVEMVVGRAILDKDFAADASALQLSCSSSTETRAVRDKLEGYVSGLALAYEKLAGADGRLRPTLKALEDQLVEAELRESKLPSSFSVVHLRIMRLLDADSSARQGPVLNEFEIRDATALSLNEISAALGPLRVTGYISGRSAPARSKAQKYWLTPKGRAALETVGRGPLSPTVA